MPLVYAVVPCRSAFIYCSLCATHAAVSATRKFLNLYSSNPNDTLLWWRYSSNSYGDPSTATGRNLNGVLFEKSEHTVQKLFGTFSGSQKKRHPAFLYALWGLSLLQVRMSTRVRVHEHRCLLWNKERLFNSGSTVLVSSSSASPKNSA